MADAHHQPSLSSSEDEYYLVDESSTSTSELPASTSGASTQTVPHPGVGSRTAGGLPPAVAGAMPRDRPHQADVRITRSAARLLGNADADSQPTADQHLPPHEVALSALPSTTGEVVVPSAVAQTEMRVGPMDMQTRKSSFAVRDYLAKAFPATWANQHQMVAEVQLTKDAALALAPQLDALQKHISEAPMDEAHLADAIHKILASTTAESIIANAITKGVGSMVGSAIIRAIFESIKAPFEIGHDVAGSINDIGSALDHVSGAVDKFADATQKIDASVAGIKDTITTDLNKLRDDLGQQALAEQGQSTQTANRTLAAFDRLSERLRDISLSANRHAANTRQFNRQQHVDTRDLLANAMTQAEENVLAQHRRDQALTRDAVRNAAPLPNLGTHQEFRDSLGRRRRAGVATRFGDHSVTMISNTTEWAIEQEYPDQVGAPSVWRDAVQQQHSWANVVTTNDHHDLIVNSTNVWYNADGTEAHRVNFNNTVVHGIINIVAAHHVVLPTVHMLDGVVTGLAEDVSIAEFTVGGQINDRQVQNTLHGKLQAANPAFLKNIANRLGDKLLFYDNSYMYAKLAHYILMDDFFNWAGIAPQAQAWNADIHWINLDDANLDYALVAHEMDAGSIFFIDRFDWQNTGAQALQLLYLLSSGAHRLICADAGTHGPPARYYQWDPVRICVLAHGAAPAAPAVGLVPRGVVWAFARKIAADRNEQDQLVRGLYAAMELACTDLLARGDQAANHSMMSPFYGSPNVNMNRTRDANFLARLLKVLPPYPQDPWHLELQAFETRTSQTRWYTIGVVGAMLRAMTTTTLASANITHQQIEMWAQEGVEPLPDSLFSMLSDLDSPTNTYTWSQLKTDALLKQNVRRMVSFYLHTTLLDNIWSNGHFLFVNNSMAEASLELTYDGINANYPSRVGTLYALTALMTQYPLEWGCSDKGAFFNIEKEVLPYGPQAARGWYSQYGDAALDDAPYSDEPYKLRMYGWQVLQCIVNRIWPAAAPVLHGCTHAWSPGITKHPWTNQDVAALMPQWNADAHAYEPCSFRSYDWADETLYTVRLSLADQWWVSLRYTDGSIPVAGFFCPLRAPGAAPTPVRGMMRLKIAGRNRPSQPADAAAASHQPSLN